jgi:cysteine desulfurase
MQQVYLDHAATTPLLAPVREALLPFLDGEFGNASSRHPLGVRAAAARERAREQVAAALLVEPRQVTFTSGGTEAANLAVLGIARANAARGRHVLVGATEHACVRACASQLAREGFEVESVPLDTRGEVDLAAFAARVRSDTTLVAQMLVNNETGAVHPVSRMARVARARAPHVQFAVDAVQAFGKLDCALSELHADALFLSAHKIGGPKGAGALALAPRTPIEPLLHGGGQEHGLRPGTENVAAIVGLGAAAELSERQRASVLDHFKTLRARFLSRLGALEGFRVLESASAQQPGILALLLRGAPAEVTLHHLAQRGVFVSAGSACQARSRELSPGLKAIGLSDDEARRMLRISMASTTSEADIDVAAAAIVEVARELERLAS